MFLCHSDLIRGPNQEEDQLSLSPLFWCPPSELPHTALQKSQRLVFIHHENWWFGESVHKPQSKVKWKKNTTKQKTQNKIKRFITALLGYVGRAVQFSSLGPGALKRESVPWADTGHPAHKTARMSSQRDTGNDKWGKQWYSFETSSHYRYFSWTHDFILKFHTLGGVL